MTAICPVNGCTEPTSSKRRMCSRHWYYVPSNLFGLLHYAMRLDSEAGGRRNYDRALRYVCDFAGRAADFVEAPTGNPPGGGGALRSDIRSESYRPGRGLRRRAVARAAVTGETFDRALVVLVAKTRRRIEANEEMQRRFSEETREEREQLRAERRTVFPKPDSVYAIPAGAIDSSRRRH